MYVFRQNWFLYLKTSLLIEPHLSIYIYTDLHICLLNIWLHTWCPRWFSSLSESSSSSCSLISSHSASLFSAFLNNINDLYNNLTQKLIRSVIIKQREKDNLHDVLVPLAVGQMGYLKHQREQVRQERDKLTLFVGSPCNGPGGLSPTTLVRETERER